jgi:hypothetical protein
MIALHSPKTLLADDPIFRPRRDLADFWGPVATGSFSDFDK